MLGKRCCSEFAASEKSRQIVTPEIQRSLRRLAGQFLKWLLKDPAVQAELLNLSRELLAFDEERKPPDEGLAEGQASETAAVANERKRETIASTTAEGGNGAVEAGLPELRIGRIGQEERRSSICSYDPRWASDSVELDFYTVAQRCRLKAQACRYVSERLLAGEFTPELAARYKQLLAEAETVQPCYLWMLHHSFAGNSAGQIAGSLAGAFEVLADVLELVPGTNDASLSPSLRKELLTMVAEAQSALRAACLQHGQDREEDQFATYEWLRAKTKQERIFLDRFMRAEDRADPERWEERRQRVLSLREAISQLDKKDKELRKRWNNLKYKLSLRDHDGRVPESEWPRIQELVHEIVQLGVAPSSPELRGLLYPVVDQIANWEDAPQGFVRTFEFVQQYHKLQQANSDDELEWNREPTPQVTEVARILERRALVLIGGDERPHLKQALIEAFRLSDLYWVATRPHQSIDGFEPYVRRPEVAAVLLAIRWSSHSYGEVESFCRKYDKPLVRLPGGCNPNQVAAEILDQISKRLNTA
jgi:hypothetical protein